MKNKILSSPALLVLLSTATHAATPFDIPKESGWSGFISGGVNITQNKSNLYLGPTGENDGNKYVEDKNSSVKARSKLAPSFNVDLRYTLGDSRTQFYLGNLIQDSVRLDFSQQVGVRQQVGQSGIFSASYVFSGLANKVWQDPYAFGVDRSDTKRNTRGVQIGWQNILGSNFSADYTYRNLSIKNETSGQLLYQNNELTSTQMQMLDRNGYSNSSRISYFYAINQRQYLIPEFRYVDNQRNGSAMSNQQYGMLVSYFWRSMPYNLVSNIYVGKIDYSQENPIFGKKTNSTDFAANVTLFRSNIFHMPKLSLYGSLAYGEIDSDVTFFNSQLSNLAIGMMYRF
ncbi:MAG: DUF2860 family protein [Plesiomonas sp.]|uniref:DUF2860 family protein n=1 Tax=Plesiomonas sp. TaxID=2486279 RepID=UPI003F34AD61